MKWLGLGLILLAPGVSFADSSNTVPVYDTGAGNAGITCAAEKNGGNLGCTAKDTSIALVNVGGGSPSCIAGVTPTVDLSLAAQLATSATVRHSLGIYIALDGKSPQLTVANGGSAACDVFGTPTTPSPWSVDGTNTCGNLTSAATGTFNLPHTVTVPCTPDPVTGMVTLNALATWDQQANTCSAAANITVGTTSKCKAGTFLIPVIGSLIIKKVAANGGATTFPFTTNVTTPPSFTLINGAQQVIQTNAAITATPQTVSATEGATAGWGLTSITCVDINGVTIPPGSFVTIDAPTRFVSANLSAANPSATCTYTNSQSGSVTVTKQITGAAADITNGYVAASPFPITINCGVGHTQLFNLINGATSAALTGVPAGTLCSFTEGALPAPHANYAYGTPVLPANVTVAAGITSSGTVQNPISRLNSSITINKTVSGGPAAGVAATFGYSANCGADGTFPITVTTSAATNQGTNTILNVPAGAVCSVTETTVPAAPANYAYGTTPGPNSVTASVASQTPGSNPTSFTNTLTRQNGSLTVNKIVTVPGGSGLTGVSGAFTFNADCSASGDGATHAVSITLTNALTGGSTIPLPAGAMCTVAEQSQPTAPVGYMYGTALYAGNPATVPANAAATVTVTDPLAAVAAGSISVTKAVVGGPNPAGSFSITVACPAAPGIAAYSSTLSVAAGATVPFTGIPTPNTCTVTESSTLPTPPTNYIWDVSNTPPPAITGLTVAAGGSNTATVTNTLVRQTSTITVQKTVTGGPAGGVTATFTFSADCGADDASPGVPFTTSIALTAATSGSNTISSVPAGATCTVSEGALPTPPANYVWGASPPSVMLTTTNAGPNNAAFTNTLSRPPSTITVTKTVTGAPVAGIPSSTFNFNVDCGADDASAGVPYTSAVTLSGTTTTLAGTPVSVPAGAVCTVTEQAPLPAPPTNYSYGAIPAGVTLPATTAATDTPVTVTNALTPNPGTLNVVQVVNGPGANLVNGTFTYTVDCGVAGFGTQSITITGGVSNSISFSGIPANTTCTVTQTGIAAAPAGEDFGPPVYSPAFTVVILAGGTSTVTITNTLFTPFIQIAVPLLNMWFMLLMGIALLLIGAYVQRQRSKN